MHLRASRAYAEAVTIILILNFCPLSPERKKWIMQRNLLEFHASSKMSSCRLTGVAAA